MFPQWSERSQISFILKISRICVNVETIVPERNVRIHAVVLVSFRKTSSYTRSVKKSTEIQYVLTIDFTNISYLMLGEFLTMSKKNKV